VLSLRATVVEVTVHRFLRCVNHDNNAIGKMSSEDIKKSANTAKYSFVLQLFERRDNANFAVGVITCACATVAGAIRLCTCSIRARNTCSLLLLPLLFPSKNIPTLDEYQYFFLLPLSLPFPSLHVSSTRGSINGPFVRLKLYNRPTAETILLGYASNAYNTKVYLLFNGFQRIHV